MDRTNKTILKLLVLLISVTVAMVYLKVVASKRAAAAERQKASAEQTQAPAVMMSSSKTAIGGIDFIELKDVPHPTAIDLSTSSKSGPGFTAEQLERIIAAKKEQEAKAPEPEDLAFSSKSSGPPITAEELKQLMEERKEEEGDPFGAPEEASPPDAPEIEAPDVDVPAGENDAPQLAESFASEGIAGNMPPAMFGKNGGSNKKKRELYEAARAERKAAAEQAGQVDPKQEPGK